MCKMHKRDSPFIFGSKTLNIAYNKFEYKCEKYVNFK